MSEENEKIDDFISLWKKKKSEPSGEPSAISETIDKLKQIELSKQKLQEENTDLRLKIKENIELLGKTEVIIKEGLEERRRLQAEKERAVGELEAQVARMKREYSQLKTDFYKVEIQLNQYKDELLTKELDKTPEKEQLIEKNALIQELQQKIQNLNGKINNYEDKIEELSSRNTDLINKIERLESPPKSSTPAAAPVDNTKTLETLCQDLQSELNKYKRIVDKLKVQNTELKKGTSGVEIQVDNSELEDLKKENQELKDQLSKLKKIAEDSKASAQQTDEIERLKSELESKNQTIQKLREEGGSQSGVPGSLVDDLQSTINKYKRIIKQLKEENADLKKK